MEHLTQRGLDQRITEDREATKQGEHDRYSVMKAILSRKDYLLNNH